MPGATDDILSAMNSTIVPAASACITSTQKMHDCALLSAQSLMSSAQSQIWMEKDSPNPVARSGM